MGQILTSIKNRRNFYRDYYRSGLVLLIFMLLLILLLSIGVVLVYSSQPEPDYYATSNAGALVPLKVYDDPNTSDTPLIN